MPRSCRAAMSGTDNRAVASSYDSEPEHRLPDAGVRGASRMRLDGSVRPSTRRPERGSGRRRITLAAGGRTRASHGALLALPARGILGHAQDAPFDKAAVYSAFATLGGYRL